jgi:putative aldouronate transport system permease protein
MDGANDIFILFRVVLPLSLPVVAVMVLFYGVGYWNAWFNAMLYIQTRTKLPLQSILREILRSNAAASQMSQGASLGDQFTVGESIQYATIVVATLPILCLYPFIQKYFVKGIMIGAVKG